MSEQLSDPSLDALATALANLQPTGGINRDRLLYRAGQASRFGWVWPSSTVILSLLTVALLLRPVPEPVERVVYVAVPAPASPQPPEPASAAILADDAWRGQAEYLKLRDLVLEKGLEGLPDPPPPSPAERLPPLESLFQ